MEVEIVRPAVTSQMSLLDVIIVACEIVLYQTIMAVGSCIQ